MRRRRWLRESGCWAERVGVVTPLPRATDLLVLDKSWLQGTSDQQLRGAAKTHRLMVSVTLFHEILTASDWERRLCLTKLKKAERAVVLGPGLGELLRFEREECRSCLPLEERLHASAVEIHLENPVASGIFTPEQEALLAENRAKLEKEMVEQWMTAWQGTATFLPELPNAVRGGQRGKLEELHSRVTDANLIRKVYSLIRRDWMPAPEAIDKTWAHFRRVQVLLLAGVEYTRRYGPTFADVPAQRIGNYYLDLEYVTLAALSGALATNEVQLKKWLGVLAPTARVVSS